MIFIYFVIFCDVSEVDSYFCIAFKRIIKFVRLRDSTTFLNSSISFATVIVHRISCLGHLDSAGRWRRISTASSALATWRNWQTLNTFASAGGLFPYRGRSKPAGRNGRTQTLAGQVRVLLLECRKLPSLFSQTHSSPSSYLQSHVCLKSHYFWEFALLRSPRFTHFYAPCLLIRFRFVYASCVFLNSAGTLNFCLASFWHLRQRMKFSAIRFHFDLVAWSGTWPGALRRHSGI